MEWLAEDSHAPDLAYHEFELEEEPLPSIKTQEDPFHSDAQTHAVHELTAVTLTNEYIKTEFMLDEEFIDNFNDSEAKRKQHLLAQADDQWVRVSISDISETTELFSRSDAAESLRKARKDLPAGERLFQCEICPRAFGSKFGIERHLSTHAIDRKREFACDICGKTFFSKDNLEEHKKIHNNTGHTEFRVFCEVCGASFSQKGNLRAHVRRKHLDKAQSITTRFECGICSRSCSTNWRLKVHIRIHSNDRTREFACDLCDKKFYCKNALWSHKRTHTTRKRQFACDFCDKTFYTYYVLKRHKKNIHNEASEVCDKLQSTTPRPQHTNNHSITSNQKSSFICEVCDSSFTTKGSLKRHMLGMHPAPRTAADDSISTNQILKDTRAEEAIFSCGICLRSFHIESIFQMHLRWHSKDKKPETSCGLCERKFDNRKQLWYHKKMHSSKPHHCKVCGQHFRQEERLKLHMLRRQHFDKTKPHKAVSIKTEISASASHFERTQQPALAVEDEDRPRVIIAEDSVVCEICHGSYPGELIDSHMRLSHQTFKCQFCPRVCSKKSYLRRHMRIHNNNRTRPYSCEKCGFKFIAKDSLKKHIITQHAQNTNPKFNCKFCEKKFHTKIGCQRHIKTHTGETVASEVSGARFTGAKSLKNHMLPEQTTKTQQFTPDTGNDNSLQTKEELVSDEEFLEEKTYSSLSSKLYHCKVCGECFKREESLSIHMLRLEHFDKTSDNTAVNAKPEQISDEEFIDEENDSDSVAHPKGTQQTALVIDDEHRDGRVTLNTEPISDEEFIQEGNDGDSVSHVGEAQRRALEPICFANTRPQHSSSLWTPKQKINVPYRLRTS